MATRGCRQEHHNYCRARTGIFQVDGSCKGLAAQQGPLPIGIPGRVSSAQWSVLSQTKIEVQDVTTSVAANST
jgi:hypothetical protein